MPYYVVNVGRGRSSTHIMKSGSAHVPGLANQVVIGYAKTTLCGLTASRYVDVFTPSEASCRECKKRWQVAVAAEAAKSANAPQRPSPLGREAGRAAAVPLFAGSVLLIGVSVALGAAAVRVYAPCAKPYAECAANGHLGELWGGLLLFILTAIFGIGGLGLFIAFLSALFKPKRRSNAAEAEETGQRRESPPGHSARLAHAAEKAARDALAKGTPRSNLGLAAQIAYDRLTAEATPQPPQQKPAKSLPAAAEVTRRAVNAAGV